MNLSNVQCRCVNLFSSCWRVERAFKWNVQQIFNFKETHIFSYLFIYYLFMWWWQIAFVSNNKTEIKLIASELEQSACHHHHPWSFSQFQFSTPLRNPKSSFLLSSLQSLLKSHCLIGIHLLFNLIELLRFWQETEIFLLCS